MVRESEQLLELARLLPRFPRLRRLRISGMPEEEDEVQVNGFLLAMLPASLEELELSFCGEVRLSGAKSGGSPFLPNLRRLRVFEALLLQVGQCMPVCT